MIRAGRQLPRTPSVLLLALALILGACGASGALPPTTPIDSLQPETLPGGSRLTVLATTTLVGDLLRQVGGDMIDLHVMLTPGLDPHGYQATPGDMRVASGAGAIFVSGFGLEGSMLTSLADSFPGVPLVDLSQGLQPLGSADGGASSAPADVDPHVWLDPLNVVHWAENAAHALGRLDPANQAGYAENARQYAGRLEQLDGWIRSQAETLAPGRRLLVTGHLMLDYFARRYDFEVLGSLVSGYSSEAEASARALAALEDAMRSAGARAIFIEQGSNPQLADTVAGDIGVRVIKLYVGSLSRADGPAADYTELMHYNVRTIVEALQ